MKICRDHHSTLALSAGIFVGVDDFQNRGPADRFSGFPHGRFTNSVNTQSRGANTTTDRFDRPFAAQLTTTDVIDYCDQIIF
jgi:hypothetical protein